MRKLVTYNKSQYKALIDQLGVDGFKLMSLLELHGSDQISELLSEKKRGFGSLCDKGLA